MQHKYNLCTKYSHLKLKHAAHKATSVLEMVNAALLSHSQILILCHYFNRNYFLRYTKNICAKLKVQEYFVLHFTLLS